MAKAIGIDLGTTNSVMTLQARGLSVLQNAENEEVTRSMVSSYRGETRVGLPAVHNMVNFPKDTIISIKRLMGRAYSDPKVQELKNKKDFVFYEIVPPEDGSQESMRVVMGGKAYSPVDISAMILRKLKNDAEKRLGDKVEYAVITVPAYFSEKQKEATRKAGWEAGLKVQRLLAEPTAAAVAYGMNNLDPSEARTLLVYDFGGGTLDISILQVVGSIFAELANDGDLWLGGDNFDELLVGVALDKLKSTHDLDLDALVISNERKDRFKIFLRQAAEKAKIALSGGSKAPIVVSGALEDENRNPIDVDVEITRAEFERLITPQVQRSMEIVERALEKARVSREQIDHVLLVGGSTSIPLVQRYLADYFGEGKLMRNLDPMKCVAQGAGIMAAVLGEIKECPKCGTANDSETIACSKCGYIFTVLGNVTGLPYGIQTAGDVFDIIIPVGSPYPSPAPVKPSHPYRTKKDNQRRIKIPVLRGDDPVASSSKNELMRTLWLVLPKGLSRGTPVEVALGLSQDEILDHIHVRVLDGSSRPLEVFSDRGEGERVLIEARIEEGGRQWAEKLAKADLNTAARLETLYDEIIEATNNENFAAAKEKLREFEGLLAGIGVDIGAMRKANNVCDFTEVMVDRYKYLIPADNIYKLNRKVEEVRNSIKSGNEAAAQEKMEELEKMLYENKPACYLMILNNAAADARERGQVAEAEAIKRVVHQAEAAGQRDDADAFWQAINEGGEALGRLTDQKLEIDDGTVERVKSY
ncbi:MAG: hypothetical protein C4567_14480 [Deltaproteobacteria bacterium]|nr:MAG: hypothetical protein C4567_14480 [Deltaproteobacteria bacterium]